MSVKQCVLTKAAAAGLDYEKFNEQNNTIKDKIDAIKNNAGSDKNYTLAAKRMLEDHKIELADRHRLTLQSIIKYSQQIEKFRSTLPKTTSSSKLLKYLKEFIMGDGQRANSIQTAVPNAQAGFHTELINEFYRIVNNGKKDITVLRAFMSDPKHQINTIKALMDEEQGLDKVYTNMAAKMKKMDAYNLHLLRSYGFETTELEDRITAQTWNLDKIDPGMAVGEAKKEFREFTDSFINYERSYPKRDTSTQEKKYELLDEVFNGLQSRYGGALEGDNSLAKKDINFWKDRSKRRIFFNTANGFYQVLNKYGHGNLFDGMMADLSTTAKKVGTSSIWGPRPYETAKLFMDHIQESDEYSLTVQHQAKAQRFLKNYMKWIVGDMDGSSDLTWRKRSFVAKSFNSITYLGGMIYRAIPSDYFNLLTEYTYRGMGGKRIIGSTCQALGHTAMHILESMKLSKKTPGSKEFKDIAATLGQSYETIQHLQNEAGIISDRYGKFAGNIARYNNVVSKFAGIGDHDKGLKTVSSVGASRYLGENAKLPYEKLNPKLKRWISHYNISSKEWDLWRENMPMNETGIKNCLLPACILHKDLTAEESLTLQNKQYQLLRSGYKNIVPTGMPERLKMKTSSLPGGLKFVIDNVLQFKGYALNYYKFWKRAMFGSESVTENIMNTGLLFITQMTAGYLTYNFYRLAHNKPLDNTISGLLPNTILQSLGILGENIANVVTNPAQISKEFTGPLVQSGIDFGEYLGKMGEIGWKSLHDEPERRNAENAKQLTANILYKFGGLTKVPLALAAAVVGFRKAFDDHMKPYSYERHEEKDQDTQRKKEETQREFFEKYL